MATPTTPDARLFAAAFKLYTTWGTAVAVGAGAGMRVFNIPEIERAAPYLRAREADAPVVLEGKMGQKAPIVIPVNFDMRYDPGGIGVMLAMLYGTAGAPAIQGGTAAQLHTLQWADHIYGKFGTFVFESPAKVWEIASAKPISADFSLADGLLKGAITLHGDNLSNASATNAYTQADAITYADNYNRCRLVNCTVQINAQSGGAVTSETALEVSELAVHIERPPDTKHAAGSLSIIEPITMDSIFRITLTCPRSNTVNQAWFASFNAETEQKMQISFSGETIAGAYDYWFKMMFPRLRIVSCPAPGGEDLVQKIVLEGEEASAAPTGMSYARPYILLQNKRTTDYLA